MTSEKEYAMAPPVKVTINQSTMRIVVKAVNAYDYSYGAAIPVLYEADITDALEGRDQAEAIYFSDMLHSVSMTAIRTKGKPVAARVPATEPLPGCTMVCFYESGGGANAARVALTHPEHEVIAYARDVNSAIKSANETMVRLLKRT